VFDKIPQLEKKKKKKKKKKNFFVRTALAQESFMVALD